MNLLLHLPYPCIYLKTPGLHEHVDGCFVWIEYDLERKSPEFRVQVVLEGYEDSIPMVMHLIQGGTIHDCIQDTLQATRENINYEIPDEAYTDTARTILTVIQLILYLSAENADVVDVPPPLKPARGNGNTIKLVQDKASEVAVKNVGIRVGAALRKARMRYEQDRDSAGTESDSGTESSFGMDCGPGTESAPGTGCGPSIGRRVRAHARRGHWHHYWSGPKAGDRKLVLKWTAPTIIHPEDGLNDVITIVPVKK